MNLLRSVDYGTCIYGLQLHWFVFYWNFRQMTAVKTARVVCVRGKIKIDSILLFVQNAFMCNYAYRIVFVADVNRAFH